MAGQNHSAVLPRNQAGLPAGALPEEGLPAGVCAEAGLGAGGFAPVTWSMLTPPPGMGIFTAIGAVRTFNSPKAVSLVASVRPTSAP